MNSFKENPASEIQFQTSASNDVYSGASAGAKSTDQTIDSKSRQESQITDLVCVSHLRWDFVYQRPQHLLSRFAKQGRVVFFEEPIFIGEHEEPRLEISNREDGKLLLAVPHIPHGRQEKDLNAIQAVMLEGLVEKEGFKKYILWMYTPMGVNLIGGLNPAVTVFDCMDELSAFKGADPRLLEFESQLMQKADLVFTGGHSIYEAKKHKHKNAHPFPSSIDRAHFAKALQPQEDPTDQAHIAHPRAGFFGVVDERFDIELLDAIARKNPDVQFVIIGPVVKIDPAILPRRENIHYLGGKHYNELPQYLAHWDVALLPFALNESTRFISPTKTPEYLAAGKPVVSTPIQDVVKPYGEKGLVEIALTPEAFSEAIRRALASNNDAEWKQSVDTYLSTISWDKTFQAMNEQIHQVLKTKSN